MNHIDLVEFIFNTFVRERVHTENSNTDESMNYHFVQVWRWKKITAVHVNEWNFIHIIVQI